MNIIDQFGRKGATKGLGVTSAAVVEPSVTLPIPRRPAGIISDEKQVQAVKFLAELNDTAAALRVENQRLAADLHVSELARAHLEEEVSAMRSDLEAYRRYSVEIRTHLETIEDQIHRAHHAAIEAGERSANLANVAKKADELESALEVSVGDQGTTSNSTAGSSTTTGQIQ